jgi:hypothetical protein
LLRKPYEFRLHIMLSLISVPYGCGFSYDHLRDTEETIDAE